MKGVTMQDVAALANVSLATVSRVLNVPQTVTAIKRRRVEEAIETLGYFPQGAARTLKSRRSMTVGAVFPRLNSILFGSFFNEMQQRLDEAGFTLTVTTTGYRLDAEVGRVRQLLSHGADALVLVGALHSEETNELIDRYEIPRINIWSWLSDSPYNQIGFCNREAMARMAAYVCALGHRRIGLISGVIEGNDRAEARRDGFKSALRACCVSADENRIIETPFGIEEGAIAFGQLMDGAEPPTAVICTSDIFAFGALREARRRGLDVPGAVSITGFDDTEFAEITVPALTTVRTPRRLMAERCAQMLASHLSEARQMASLQLDTELIIRDSAGPAKGG